MFEWSEQVYTRPVCLVLHAECDTEEMPQPFESKMQATTKASYCVKAICKPSGGNRRAAAGLCPSSASPQTFPESHPSP